MLVNRVVDSSVDPAIERWVEMRHGLYKNFRWTGKSTRQTVMWGLVFPVAIYFISTSVEVRPLLAVDMDVSLTVR